jgi:hypothetical protein
MKITKIKEEISIHLIKDKLKVIKILINRQYNKKLLIIWWFKKYNNNKNWKSSKN